MLYVTRQNQKQVADMLSQITGLEAMLNSNGDMDAQFMEQYPNAAFVYRLILEPYHHDSELNQINYEAVKAILNGEPITSVQHHHNRKMEQYVTNHLWDA